MTFNLSDFSFTKHDSFDVVRGNGLPMSMEIGAPMLPVKDINLIVPTGSDVSSITITAANQQVLNGTFHIYPAQPPGVTSLNAQERKFISPNSTIYSSNSPYPSTPVVVTNSGYFDGATKIVHLQIYPLKYEPANGGLTLFTNISFTLNFKPSTEKAIHVKRRAKIAQDAYDQALRALVDNPEMISAYQQRPDSVYVDVVSVGGVSNFNTVQPNLPPSPPPYPTPAPLTIIAPYAMSSYFTNFINQKAADGIRAKVVTIESIYKYVEYYYPNGDDISNPPLNDLPGQLRKYLSVAYGDGLTWVILVGEGQNDYSHVPTRWVPDVQAVYPGEMVPTDLYYSDLTGNWNPNNFAPSLVPSLFVGRLPLTSQQDISAWTNKVVQYETNPFSGNSSAVAKVLWSESDEMEDLQEAEWVSTVLPPTFSQSFIEEVPSGSSSNPTSPTGAQIISTLNTGCGFYNMYHHGSPANVAVRTSGYNLSYRESGIHEYGIFSYDSYDPYNTDYIVESGNGFDNISNTCNCTILYSIACDVAEYDSAAQNEGIPGAACLAKAWLRVSGGGPAFLGNTREGLWRFESSKLEKYFLQEIFNRGNTRIGQAEANSKVDYGTASDGLFLAESHNLFGDPSMIMRTTAPSGNMAQSYPRKDELTSENLPREFDLFQNYPNPFNPSTTIRFALPTDSYVTLKVYDVLGREIMTLTDGYQNAGYHDVKLDGTKLSSGIYFYKLTANNFVSMKKMLIAK